jgi:hypothetical protein
MGASVFYKSLSMEKPQIKAQYKDEGGLTGTKKARIVKVI